MNCEYLKHMSNYGYICIHPQIYESAKLYEKQKKKYITKFSSFIGYTEPKRCLSWCPLKIKLEE